MGSPILRATMLRNASRITSVAARSVQSRGFVIKATVDAPIDTSKIEYAAPDVEQRKMVARLRATRAFVESQADQKKPLGPQQIQKLKDDMDMKISQLENRLGVDLTSLKKGI